MVETAAGLVTSWMVPKYDAGNPAALRRLVAAGTELRPFPRAVLEPCFTEAYKYYDELSAKDPKFKKIYDSLKAFRADQNLWFRVAENTFDNFNFSMSAAGPAKSRGPSVSPTGKAPPVARRGFLRLDRAPT